VNADTATKVVVDDVIV